MKRLLEQLMKQADEKKEMLREGNDLSEEERQIQQIELKLLVEQIEQMKNRFATLDREAPARRAPVKIAPREPLEPNFEARFDSLRQKHDELVQRAQKMERQLEGLKDGQDQEADELKLRLKEGHAEMVDVERKMEGLKRAQADDLKQRKLEDLKRAEVNMRQEKPVREEDREKLQYLRLRAEKIARALKDDPDIDSEKAKTLQRMLELIRAEIGVLEQESRGPKPKKEPVDAAPKREYRLWKEEVKIEKKAPDGPLPTVKAPASNPRLEARVYALEHVNPERIQAIVEALIDKQGTITLYANGKKATVVTTVENHQHLERIIRIIDVPEEAYRADVSKDGGKELRIMRIITLRHFSPKRMQNILGALLGQQSPMMGVVGQAGSVGLCSGARSLVVETTSANMKRVESIVQELDVPTNDRVSAAEVEELRNQMCGLSEQMRQIQDRLDRMGESEDADKANRPADRLQEGKTEY
jgi:hypothetical protein